MLTRKIASSQIFRERHCFYAIIGHGLCGLITLSLFIHEMVSFKILDRSSLATLGPSKWDIYPVLTILALLTFYHLMTMDKLRDQREDESKRIKLKLFHKWQYHFIGIVMVMFLKLGFGIYRKLSVEAIVLENLWDMMYTFNGCETKRKILEHIQWEFECCGINGPKDYYTWTKFKLPNDMMAAPMEICDPINCHLPLSCCGSYDCSNNPQDRSNSSIPLLDIPHWYKTEGCYDKIMTTHAWTFTSMTSLFLTFVYIVMYLVTIISTHIAFTSYATLAKPRKANFLDEPSDMSSAWILYDGSFVPQDVSVSDQDSNKSSSHSGSQEPIGREGRHSKEASGSHSKEMIASASNSREPVVGRRSKESVKSKERLRSRESVKSREQVNLEKTRSKEMFEQPPSEPSHKFKFFEAFPKGPLVSEMSSKAPQVSEFESMATRKKHAKEPASFNEPEKVASKESSAEPLLRLKNSQKPNESREAFAPENNDLMRKKDSHKPRRRDSQIQESSSTSKESVVRRKDSTKPAKTEPKKPTSPPKLKKKNTQFVPEVKEKEFEKKQVSSKYLSVSIEH